MKLLVITQKIDENDQLLGFFIEWLKRLAGRFDKLIVLCLERGDHDLPSNVEVVSLGKDRGYSKIRQLSTFYFLLSTLKYDAVFVHMNPIWVVLGGLCWRLMQKKIFFWYTSGGVTPKLKLAEKFSDVIFTASKESFRLKSKKVIVTGHGIDTDVFRPMPKNVRNDGNVGDNQFEQVKRSNASNNSIKILSVGRISPVKNYETLIDAAKILKDRGINFFVTMIGEAPLEEDKQYEKKLKLLITNYQLQDYFNFVGKIDHKDLSQQYQSHDIFIHLSKTGSLDKTILEAMACGMNVLSSNDSSRAFLSDELIFGDNNSAELAGKIMTVKDQAVDPKLRNYIVQNHNLDNLIEKISSYIKL